MKICDRAVLYVSHSAKNIPSLVVEPEEVFQVCTQLNTGDWLQSKEDIWHPSKNTGPNFTNCIRIQGAKPGDVLAIDILDIQVDEIAYTGFDYLINTVAQRICPNKKDGIFSRVVEVRDNKIYWSRNLILDANPMIGTIGVAPKGKEIANSDSSHHGGNMDVQEIRKGTTLYLPVYVEGALLHVGDVHAIMGDGEINRAGGLECRSKVTLRCRLLPVDESFQWIRLEDAEYIMTIACLEDAEQSFYAATGELIRWMSKDFGFDEMDAYCLLGQVMEARCTAFVNKQKTYICKIKKRYLIPDRKKEQEE